MSVLLHRLLLPWGFGGLGTGAASRCGAWPMRVRNCGSNPWFAAAGALAVMILSTGLYGRECGWRGDQSVPSQPLGHRALFAALIEICEMERSKLTLRWTVGGRCRALRDGADLSWPRGAATAACGGSSVPLGWPLVCWGGLNPYALYSWTARAGDVAWRCGHRSSWRDFGLGG